MNIACPYCGLAGTISVEKLKGSSGSVRCPRCHKTFSPAEGPPTGIDSTRKEGAAPPRKGSIKTKTPPPIPEAREDVLQVEVDGGEPMTLDEEITVQIDGINVPDYPAEDLIEDIVPLDDADIITEEEQDIDHYETDRESSMRRGIEGVHILDVPEGKKKGGLFGLFSRGKGPVRKTAEAPPEKPITKKAAVRKGLILFFITVLVLWGGYRFFSSYWPPYTQEKAFLTDSRALFDKYHELRVYLKVGMPDPVFATKVAEAAYVWEVYQEKYESRYQKDPLYASLMIMGRLFLAIKELLDRDMYPDNYLGLEWGEGFPFVTKEEYVNVMVKTIPLCILAVEENFAFTKKVLDTTAGFDFFSMTVSRIVGRSDMSSRIGYAPDLKRANKTFLALDNKMPVLEKAIVDVRAVINNTSGK